MENESTCLKFAFGVASTLDRMEKLLFSEYMSDVIFEVGDDKEKIHAHKVFLTAASEVFYAQFNGNFAESCQSNVDVPIVIPDIEPTTFREMLRFIYCEKVNIDESNAIELIYASHKYMLEGLQNVCETFFKNSCHEEKVLEAFDGNTKHNRTKIDELCLRLIQENPFLYFKCDRFSSLSKRSIKLIAASETMNCKTDQLREAIGKWSKENNDTEEFKVVLRDLQCSKLIFFGNMGYCNWQSTLDIRGRQNLYLYGLGIFVGLYKRCTPSPDKMTIAVEVGSIKLTKDVSLKKVLYVEEILFEKVTVLKNRSCRITVDMDAHKHFKNKHFFSLENCSIADQLGEVEVQIKPCGSRSFIAYLLLGID